MELGVGSNTPRIIKVPFLRMTMQNPKTTYACINLGKAVTMRGLEKQTFFQPKEFLLSSIRSGHFYQIICIFIGLEL